MRSILGLLVLPLAFSAFATSATAQQSPASGWSRTEKTDAAHGAASAYNRFTLSGKFLKKPQETVNNPPALAVDCGPKKWARSSESRFLAGSLLVGVPLKIHYVEPAEIHGTSYFQKVFVRLRFDDGKEEKMQWDPGKDKTAAVFQKDLLKKMLRAHTVEITAEDDNELPIVMQFNMTDPGLLTEACDVEVKK